MLHNKATGEYLKHFTFYNLILIEKYEFNWILLYQGVQWNSFFFVLYSFLLLIILAEKL